MKHSIYCFRDKKLGIYLIPEYSTDEKEVRVEKVIRSTKSVDKPEEIIKVRDMSFYLMGYYEDVDGKFEILELPEKLLDLEDFVKKI